MKKKPMYSNVCNYISHRRNMGLTCGEESTLKLFAEFSDQNYPGQPLTVRMATEWATLPYPRKTGSRHRLGCLRQFAKYLKIRDSRTELIPPRLLEGYSSRVQPHIFSQEEIRLFMTTKCYVLPQKINERSVKTVIGLLACTGMRVGEVLNLKNCDIDWKNSIILVRNSKRRSVRSVPIDRSTYEALRSYVQLRNMHCPKVENDDFFLVDGGKTLYYRMFLDRWHVLWRRIEEKKGEFAKRRPRIHDLRHTFACNHLLDAYKNKKNIDRELHLLSVYLGHVDVGSTYWYLSAIPELLEHVGKSFE